MKALLCLTVLLALNACRNVPTPSERLLIANQVAEHAGWVRRQLTTGTFQLSSWAPLKPAPATLLYVYIEGDGFAWRTRWSPSDDPTPTQPMGLRLALAQTTGARVYLARPCQYSSPPDPACETRYWTSHRFAAEVVAASSAAIDQLKADYHASGVVLVGYSGGAAITALLAATRSDVVGWMTVAGNIDHAAWTTMQWLNPLDGSLDPVAQKDNLNELPQWHFMGSQDRVIPAELTLAFIKNFDAATGTVLPAVDHYCCWPDLWAELSAEPVRQLERNANKTAKYQ